MAGPHKQRKKIIAISGIFKQQSALGVALANADINKAHPGTFTLQRQITREDIKDCKNKYLIGREITQQLALWNLNFEATPQLLAGWFALAYGASSVPTGTPANEVQTITIDATGGTFTISFAFEGLSSTTSALAWNSTAAQVQAALEKLRSVKEGNVTVEKTGLVYTITFTGKLAKANVSTLTTTPTLTGGAGTAQVAVTTPGANKLHPITRTSNDQTPATSLIRGFEGDSTAPEKFSDLVVNSIRVRGDLQSKKVIADIGLIGNLESELQSGFVLPDCSDERPIYVKDCRLKIDSAYYPDLLRDFDFTFSNNIVPEFAFDEINPNALERGDETSSLGYQLLGSRGDVPHTHAKNEATKEHVLQIGAPGNRVEVVAPSVLMELVNDDLFAGEVLKSAYQVSGIPLKDYSNAANTPEIINAYLNQTDAFLTI